MKESFKQKMQENKPPLTFKNTKKNICLNMCGAWGFFDFLWVYTPTPTLQPCCSDFYASVVQLGKAANDADGGAYTEINCSS